MTYMLLLNCALKLVEEIIPSLLLLCVAEVNTKPILNFFA